MSQTSERGRDASRRYWVWVTGPEFYLDADGRDRADLEPSADLQPEGWWTCHRDTEEGDLALLYRSQKARDIAYLLEATSGGASLAGNHFAEARGWDYGCEYRVLAKFAHPLALADMRADLALSNWGALRAGFRRKAYQVPPDTWSHLLDRLSFSTARIGSSRRRANRFYALERDIEDQLAADLTPFARHGMALSLLARQHQCHYGGRADLVCEDSDGRCVVIELKRGLVTREAVAQALSYLASAPKDWPRRAKPVAVIVGDRLDGEAKGMINANRQLRFLPLSELGFAHRPLTR